ncbi:protoporphyrinogen/coproporphyrinogen oxidase [Mucilaginibacter aquatilis]|uniref:NAD(P)-binding protein n=1 Tax=Mucilaginibacter aquatilis TaxID=1517760 RepID=A0A6I4IB88_9SPHI|nr:FAD-dependent oxidoreductase [Mucilaginibacter aquatilis]MVN91198.1 NAD(P)-binding protein [Mucilaginibacter aquatilis]
MVVILGAGLSGLSTADHLRKKNIEFEIFEGKSHGGGHIHSENVGGFIWDEGPHVSFTKYEYVKEYFEANCDGKFLEYATAPTNYFEGNWIPHPAQSNMYAIPEPLRSQCIDDVQKVRANKSDINAQNYQEWIDYAFGETFAKVFPKSYTKKYWTTDPLNLTTDWIGKRIYFPEISDMVGSALAPISKHTHYITKVRYPQNGGFYSFIKKVEEGVKIEYNKKVQYISFADKRIDFADGEHKEFDTLVSTLPLPEMILNSDAPEDIKLSASILKCSQVLIVNVIVNHEPPVDNHWIYVYDEAMYSTRINFTDLLAPNNGLPGKTGIQVEVYFSDYNKNTESIKVIEDAVLDELLTMKLIKSRDAIDSYHSKWINWANVIFDNKREAAQQEVLNWLSSVGLVREEDDLYPMTDWDLKQPQKLGSIILAGRFAQWKYYWTDDCVLRGQYISECI